jgi:activator of 2-hydroxyglutaryl-CoA dehydratase
MADRIFALVRGLGIKKPVIMTGGVANNKAMVRALEYRIGDKILIVPDPQLVGALGAAVIAKNIVGV